MPGPIRRAKSDELPAPVAEAVELLLSAVIEKDGVLPPWVLSRIEAISILGADPIWQVAQLKAILKEWREAH